MDFFSGLAKKATSDEPSAPDNNENSSKYDVFGSAKVVAEAAQSQFSNQPETYDKAKVAGAGADLLGAASDYGKLDETQGFGKYADQAEGYLRQYSTPKTTATTTTPAAADGPNPDSDYQSTTTTDAPAADSGDYKPADDSDYADKTVAPPTETTEAENPSFGGGDDYVKEEEGNFSNKPSSDGGDYTKKGEGFLNKQSEAEEEGLARDYSEKGEGFLNKPSYGGAEDSTGDYSEKPQEFLNKPLDEAEGESGGQGDYFKKGGDFSSKPEEGGAGEYGGGERTEAAALSESEGGYGGFVKKAGGFFK